MHKFSFPHQQQFRQDAPDRPHIDGRRVGIAGEQQLGRPIPARDDVLGHKGRGLGAGPGQAKVANFEVAGGVEEEVGGLEVAVKDVGRVDVSLIGFGEDRVERKRRMIDFLGERGHVEFQKGKMSGSRYIALFHSIFYLVWETMSLFSMSMYVAYTCFLYTWISYLSPLRIWYKKYW